MTRRQLKLGLVPTGVGGPGDSNRGRDLGAIIADAIPAGA
jgi:hypothetical protein